jgi:3-hydroxybutyryl-CoA dehydrogenase
MRPEVLVLGSGALADELRTRLAGTDLATRDVILVAGPDATALPGRPEALLGVFSAYGSALEATRRYGRPCFSFSYLPPLETAKLVEFSVGPRGPSAESVADALAPFGVERVRVGDAPGHIALRTLAQLVNEAALAVGEGIASASDIDVAMRLGVNYPDGPISWGRRIGYDLIEGVLDRLTALYGDAYRPARLLRAWAAGGDPHAG